MKRVLAPVTSAALTTADHGPVIRTATFGSLARFMADNDFSDQIYRFTAKGAQPFRN
jgi:hypothetical protein